MKKLLLYLTVLTLYGCPSISNSNLMSGASGECPEEPQVELNRKDVQEIELSNQMIIESGIAKKTKAVGFTFEAKEGQKIDYKTDDDICVWIYTPDNEQLNSKTLPKTGKYTIQVSAPKGSQTFDLAMGLDVISSETPPPNRNTNTNTNSGQLSQDDAVALIKRWQQAKRKIFASPFDRSLGTDLLTGEAYRKNVGAYDGSVNWLQNNNAYYTYRTQEVDRVDNFEPNQNNAIIDVVTLEQRTLCLNGRPSYGNNTVESRSKVRYYLQLDSGKWKISDYNTLQNLSKRSNPNTSCRIEY